MKCQKCRNDDATIHLTEIIRNVKSEFHLCEKCARLVGINSRFSNFSLSVPDMLSFLDLDEVRDVADSNICHNCGLTFLDYKKTGKLGCTQCYNYLSAPIEPLIMNYHGSARHVGKVPTNYIEVKSDSKMYLEDNSEKSDAESLEHLVKMLNSAVLDERYEDAAVLRDRIRNISGVLKG